MKRISRVRIFSACLLLLNLIFYPPALASAADATAPAVPTGLTVTEVGDGCVSLAWDANTENDLKEYRVSFSPKSGIWNAQLSYTTNSCTIGGLLNGQGYTFKVKAVNTANQSSSYSAKVSATPQAPQEKAPPDEGSGSEGSSNDGSTNSGSVETGSTTSSSEPSPAAATTGDSSSSADTSSSGSTAGDSSTSSDSLTSGSTTIDSSSPADSSAGSSTNDPSTSADTFSDSTASSDAPANSTASSEAGQADSVDSQTTGTNSDASSPSEESSASTSSGETTSGTDSQTRLTNLTCTTGAVTNVVEPPATTQTPVEERPVVIEPPAAPTGLQAIPGVGKVYLSWTPNSETDIKGYHIFYKSESSDWLSCTASSTGYTLSGLTNGCQYSFKVNAENTGGLVSPDSAIVAATPSTDVTAKLVMLGNPFNKGAYARNVWDMQLYNGRIYLGHGDLVSDGGPVPVISLDPQSGAFRTEYSVNEEQIETFKVMDNKLYIPGPDAIESWDYGNYYVLDGSWQKYRTIPKANHVFDIALYNGQLYSANSSTTTPYTVMSSKDAGRTWTPTAPSGSAFYSYDNVAFNLFEFRGKLYAVSRLFYSDTNKYNCLLAIDGSSAQPLKVSGKQMLPGGSALYQYRLVRIQEINNKLVYIGSKVANGLQWIPDNLFVASDFSQSTRVVFPESGALATDVIKRGGTAYVLASVKGADGRYRNIVYRSADLQNWSELFRFTSDAFARSFEELNGDFYFGLGCYVGITSASSGNILKVEAGAYS